MVVADGCEGVRKLEDVLSLSSCGMPIERSSLGSTWRSRLRAFSMAKKEPT